MNTPPSQLRSISRQPQQQRGLKRVERLLESASAIFAERGYSAATMTEIAARAEASIGSLYQFFPSKHSLATALLERYDQVLVHNFDALAARAASLTTEQLAKALLRQLRDLKIQRAGVLALLMSQGELGEQRQALRHRLESGIVNVLTAHAPDWPTASRATAAQLVSIQLKAAAALDEWLTEAQVEAVYQELAKVLEIYLRSHQPGPSGKSS